MPWRVRFTRHAEKDLKSIPRHQLPQILAQIEKLETQALNLDIKKLQGQAQQYRLRVGTWRVLFNYDKEASEILIESVRPRKDAY
jgi:mRNA interferase RelE/StbE